MVGSVIIVSNKGETVKAHRDRDIRPMDSRIPVLSQVLLTLHCEPGFTSTPHTSFSGNVGKLP